MPTLSKQHVFDNSALTAAVYLIVPDWQVNTKEVFMIYMYTALWQSVLYKPDEHMHS